MTWRISDDEPWASGPLDDDDRSGWALNTKNEIEYLRDKKARIEHELKRIYEQYKPKTKEPF